MSAGDQAAATLVTQLALAADGAVLGVTLAYVAARSFTKYAANSSALRRINDAPTVQVSDLRSLISGDSDGGGSTPESKFVVVRGAVEAKSVVEGTWKSVLTDFLSSKETNEIAVVVQRSQKCIYNQWRGFFGWYPDMRSVFTKAWREQGSTYMKTVPFVLVQDRNQSESDYVVVDLDSSKHPLPLTTVYHHMQPIQASPYTFLQALFGHEYPVGVLDEEKILPLGKEVSAVGICSSINGILEIKSCKDIPYFLSEMTKDQMVLELSFRSKALVWSGIIFGSLSVGILGYAIVRNWNKWKQWRQQRRAQQQQSNSDTTTTSNNNTNPDVIEEEDEEEYIRDVPDGQLCVICLIRRRRSAFVPCGHLVCCQRCALSVQRDLAPKCPLCRQAICNSVRIYDS